MERRERLLWWLLWPTLFAFGLTGEVIQARNDAAQNVVIEFLGGFAFAVAGLIAWRLRPENHLGRLMTLVSPIWFIGSYAAAELNVVTSFATAFAALEAIAISHVALAYPEGRLPGRGERALIITGYAAALTASLTILLTFNPRRDVPCECATAPLGLFSNPPLLRFAFDTADKIAGGVVLVAVILLVRRLIASNVTQRWLLAALWIAAVVAGTVFLVRTTVNVVEISDQAMGRVDDFLNAMTVLIPVAFLAGLLRTRLDASPLGDLLVALGGGTSGETVQLALARTLHDPSVQLAYWLPDRGLYVDATGREFALPDESRTRTTTLVERDGERLAAIVHDRALLENRRLVEATTAAAGLALDNERLQAELRAQIFEVAASRTRIVRASDDARRRIERDLHDGAQQRLLAMALALRMTNDELPADTDPSARQALEHAAAETLLAVNELRELAQGIHPAILSEQGLRAAIEGLAERAPVAVVVDVPDDRFPAPIESTVYFVVSEALTNVVKHANARCVTVHARREGGSLVVDITDDGAGGATCAEGTGLPGLYDRVAALGGRVELRSPLGHGTHLRIELPCS